MCAEAVFGTGLGGNMKAGLRIFLLAVALVAQVSFACADESKLNYTIITSDRIEGFNQELESGIEAALGQAEAKQLDYNSEEATEWIKRLDIKFIPYVIFDRAIVDNHNFFGIVRRDMVEQRMGEYVIPKSKMAPIGIMLFEREQLAGRLDLFVRSHDPGSWDALRQIMDYLEKNPGAFKLACHYITSFREYGIDSPGGPNEIKEDIRQLLIQKHHPDKFLEYLGLYIQGEVFADACAAIGIERAEIDGREEEGKELLRKDFDLSVELNIEYSPTFLWENQIMVTSIGKFQQLIGPGSGQASITVAEGALSISVFYRPDCPSCQWFLYEHMPGLKREFGDKVSFVTYDVSVQENFEEQLRVQKELGIMGYSLPFVAVAGKGLIGRPNIEAELRNIIEAELKGEGSLPGPDFGLDEAGPLSNDAILSLPKDEKAGPILVRQFKLFTPLAIAGAGFLDGINPCAFSTILFFLSFLALAGFGRREMFMVGAAFSLAVFLTYLGLGLGAFAGLERLRVFNIFSRYFDAGVGGLAIILGFASLYDYVRFKMTGEGKDMILRLPHSIKNAIHKSIRIIKEEERGKAGSGVARLLFAAFLVGVIVSLLESMCTGQIYLPTLTFILKMKVMWWRAFLFLMLYNAMFIFPLVVVFVLALYGVSSEWWARAVQRHLGKVKLVTALLFFALGAFIIVY